MFVSDFVLLGKIFTIVGIDIFWHSSCITFSILKSDTRVVKLLSKREQSYIVVQEKTVVEPKGKLLG